VGTRRARDPSRPCSASGRHRVRPRVPDRRDTLKGAAPSHRARRHRHEIARLYKSIAASASSSLRSRRSSRRNESRLPHASPRTRDSPRQHLSARPSSTSATTSSTPSGAAQAVDETSRGVRHIEDPSLRERRATSSSCSSACSEICSGASTGRSAPPSDAVVVAYDLSPRDPRRSTRPRCRPHHRRRAARRPHTAIIARAHEIPAVVALEHHRARQTTICC